MKAHRTSGRKNQIIISGFRVPLPLLEETGFSNRCLNSNGKRNLSRVAQLRLLTLGLSAPRMSFSKFISISMMTVNNPIMQKMATSPKLS
jgi:hypothetical protein